MALRGYVSDAHTFILYIVELSKVWNLHDNWPGQPMESKSEFANFMVCASTGMSWTWTHISVIEGNIFYQLKVIQLFGDKENRGVIDGQWAPF